MSKSSMLQSIIAFTISTSIKKALNAIIKNIERLEVATIYKNLVQALLKTRETTRTKKI